MLAFGPEGNTLLCTGYILHVVCASPLQYTCSGGTGELSLPIPNLHFKKANNSPIDSVLKNLLKAILSLRSESENLIIHGHLLKFWAISVH